MRAKDSLNKAARPASSSRTLSVRISIFSWRGSEPTRTNLEPFPVVRQPSGQMEAEDA